MVTLPSRIYAHGAAVATRRLPVCSHARVVCGLCTMLSEQLTKQPVCRAMSPRQEQLRASSLFESSNWLVMTAAAVRAHLCRLPPAHVVLAATRSSTQNSSLRLYVPARHAAELEACAEGIFEPRCGLPYGFTRKLLMMMASFPSAWSCEGCAFSDVVKTPAASPTCCESAASSTRCRIDCQSVASPHLTASPYQFGAAIGTSPRPKWLHSRRLPLVVGPRRCDGMIQ